MTTSQSPIPKFERLFALAVVACLFVSCQIQGNPDESTLTANTFETGFEQAGHTWNSIASASDNKIYYSFSTTDIDQGAKFFSYDPATGDIEELADLTEVTDGTEIPRIPQGKSHAKFYERDGKLYISTHVGVHGSVADGEVALMREGYEIYPGGHLLSYDLTSGEFERLAMAPDNEGILTMKMDQERGNIFGITWPRGYFIHYDVDGNEFHNLGLVSGRGEAGTHGEDFRVLGRSIVVNPENGVAYYSTADGDIFSYNPDNQSLDLVEEVNLRLDYFGEQTPSQPGSMGYGWRQIVWHPSSDAAYGVHGKSGYLFRFDPDVPELEIVDRIASEPSKQSGMFDFYNYGYLGFDLGPDGETLYYLTGGPIYVDGVRVNSDNREELGFESRELENLHLVTYHISDGIYTDHGPVFDSNGSILTDAQSIHIDEDYIYTLARFARNGEREMDLVAIPNPIGN